MGKRRFAIIGAGPCGIGAAWYLHKKGYKHWTIYEQNPYVGGLAASFRDDKGFTWDIGGHVLFSHHPEFTRFLDEVLGNDYLAHKRNAWVRIPGSWVPYPLQNNIHFLPRGQFKQCMRELTRLSPGKAPAKDFRQWLVANFGRSISRSYLIPLNEKMWVYPLEKMSAEWMARRVSCMDLKEIKSKLKSGTQAGTGWGPNSTFIYPASGGIGEVFRRASSGFGSRLVLGCRAVKIDLRSRTVFFADGKRQAFDALINTSSLKEFVPMLYPLNPRLVKSVKRLRHNRLLVIGVGLKKKGKDKRNWLYFPERSYPFFRVTNLSNYSSYNLPEGKSESYSSLLAEMAFSEKAPLKIKRRPLIEATIKHLVYGGLMCEADRSRIESIFCLQAEQAYPIPTLDREEALLEIEGYLEKNSILSRGRFGSFRYEQGNMDDCFTQGFTAARRIVER